MQESCDGTGKPCLAWKKAELKSVVRKEELSPVYALAHLSHPNRDWTPQMSIIRTECEGIKECLHL